MILISQIRRHVAHYVAAAFAVLLILAIAMAHRYSPDQPSDLLDSFVHSLHGPGFVGVAIVAFAALESYRDRRENYLFAAVIAMGIGLISEIAQIPGPRDASFSDLVVDGVAVLGGLTVVGLFDRDLREWLGLRRYLAGLAVGLLALGVSVGPSITYAYVMVAQRQAMPTLLSFEHRWESRTTGRSWGRRTQLIPAPANWPDEDQQVALTQEAGNRGILMRLLPYPDWQDYKQFSFIAASADERSHDLKILISDIRPRKTPPNRFSADATVTPTPTRIVIDFDDIRKLETQRPFDFRHVESVELRVSNPGSGATILIDDFRLEP